MIRKAIIVVLTLASLGSVAFWFDSQRALPRTTSWGKQVHFGENLLAVDFVRRNDDPGFYATPGILQIRYEAPDQRRFNFLGRGLGRRVYIQSTSKRGFGEFRFFRRVYSIPLGARNTTVSILSVRVPLWAGSVLFAAYPSVAFIRGPLRRWRRRRRGCCIACGYNLTGNVSGVCPECGEAT